MVSCVRPNRGAATVQTQPLGPRSTRGKGSLAPGEKPEGGGGKSEFANLKIAGSGEERQRSRCAVPAAAHIQDATMVREESMWQLQAVQLADCRSPPKAVMKKMAHFDTKTGGSRAAAPAMDP